MKQFTYFSVYLLTIFAERSYILFLYYERNVTVSKILGMFFIFVIFESNVNTKFSWNFLNIIELVVKIHNTITTRTKFIK